MDTVLKFVFLSSSTTIVDVILTKILIVIVGRIIED